MCYRMIIYIYVSLMISYSVVDGVVDKYINFKHDRSVLNILIRINHDKTIATTCGNCA